MFLLPSPNSLKITSQERLLFPRLFGRFSRKKLCSRVSHYASGLHLRHPHSLVLENLFGLLFLSPPFPCVLEKRGSRKKRIFPLEDFFSSPDPLSKDGNDGYLSKQRSFSGQLTESAVVGPFLLLFPPPPWKQWLFCLKCDERTHCAQLSLALCYSCVGG